MEIKKLESALKKSWCGMTCYPPIREQWTKENPAFGQCAVTALIVQDFFGGELVFCSHQNHFWNRLPYGKEVDLTRSQFFGGINLCVDEIIPRHEILQGKAAEEARTEERYIALKYEVLYEILEEENNNC
jgi:hypothetical protein